MRPRRLNLFFSAILTCALLGALLAAPASALPEKFFGMTAHESMNESTPDWNNLQKAGVQRFRMQIKWSTVNAAGNWRLPTTWEATYDKYFKLAANRGIEILPYLYGRKDGSSPYYLKSETNNYKEWLEFAEFFAARYGQNGSFWVYNPSLPQYPVKVWEVWNEPNLSKNCPSGVCSGKAYGEFLVGTAAAIRSRQVGYNPTILFGGIYMEYFSGPSIFKYLQEAAEASGISTAYDGLSVHPYANGGTKEATRTYSEKATAAQGNIANAYSAQGVAKLPTKPLWVTEIGWPVDGTEAQHVTPSEQAGLLNETYNWAKANWSTYNVKYVAWYFYKDFPGGKWDLYTGLRESNGAYRPSWWAYLNQTGVLPWPGGQVAYQASSTQLFSFSNAMGSGNTGLGMAAGTSPSVTTLSHGEYVMALQANTKTLWVSSPSGGSGNTFIGMAAGTSPSITALPNDEYEMAFQANDGNLWVRSSSGAFGNTGFGMKPGTSPSITALPNGEYVIAFQANDGNLWVRSSSGAFGNTGFGMKPGTSPSITALPNGEYVMAFQANDGALWTRSSSGAYGQTFLGMAAGTSPSIAALPDGGYVIAFQANSGTLWTRLSSGASGNTSLGMAAGTSPSVMAFPNGGQYVMAFQGNNGGLWTRFSSGGFENTALGMAAGTSPSISPPSRWSN